MRRILSLFICLLVLLIPSVYAPGQPFVLVTQAQDPSLSRLAMQKGVNVVVSHLEQTTFGTAPEKNTFKNLAATIGANWVAFGPTCFQKELNETEVKQISNYISSERDRQKYRVFSVDCSNVPKRDADLQQGIADAHSFSLKVMLKPAGRLSTV